MLYGGSMVSRDVLVAVNPAVYGLLGSLVGGFIAGTVSLLVARQARDTAERTWVRDNRREMYDRFLTYAQRLLIAAEDTRPRGSSTELEEAYTGFFSSYGVVQTVAERDVVDAVRTYAYRLLELKQELDAEKPSGPAYFRQVADLVRLARHDAIDAMRLELGRSDSAKPPDHYNPFADTPLEQQYPDAIARRHASERDERTA
jgi:hypothetical protein